VSAQASGQGAIASAEESAFAVAPLAEGNFIQSAPVALPGPRSRRSGASGPQRPEARPGLLAQAARGRSTSATPFRTSAALPAPSRGAVTRQGAAMHARTREFGREIAGDDGLGRTGAEDMRLVASPQGLTATAAHNPLRSAGRPALAHATDSHTSSGAARPADLPAAVAVSALSLAAVSGATAPASSLARIATPSNRPLPAENRTASSSHGLHLSLREEPTQPHLLTGKR
jgi:hypothetical protein